MRFITAVTNYLRSRRTARHAAPQIQVPSNIEVALNPFAILGRQR